MNRGKAPLVSLCERKFILEAIKENKRVDGRESYDYREMKISLSKEPGNVEVTLGRTRVLACVSCQVIEPRPQRPTEGILYFNVELSPMASPAFEAGKQSSLCVEITRLLERCQKESRAVDTESLCIIAGQKVWEIRIDLHVLDHCGNIIDCAAIASITALKHFRRPDVTVVGEEATIHPVSERDPVPLSVHHIPVCFTFAFFWEGEYLLVDPSLEEEQVMDGKLVVGMNIHREICVLQMMGGVAILPEQVKRCIEIAAVKCVEITEIIKCALAGKKVDPSLGYESILHNQRKEQAVDVSNSPVLIEDDEPMEQDPPQKKEKIDYLGPGTARLVGVGGDNTWAAINSLTDASDEDDGDAMQTDTGAAEAMEPVAVKKKKAEMVKDSDSEEEETMLLTSADMASSAANSKRQQQEDDDDDVILLDSPPSKTTDSRATSESAEGSLDSAEKRTSSSNSSASTRSKKKRRAAGGGGGGGDGASASPTAGGSKRTSKGGGSEVVTASDSVSGSGRPKRNAKGKAETVTATVSKKKGRGKKK